MITLLVDGNYLAWRAYHSTGMLRHNDIETGVAFGLLREVEAQIEFHGAQRVVLAFDHPSKGLRKGILPTYKSSRKSNRKDLDEEELEKLAIFYEQVRRLKQELLPMVGYRNIVEVPGYEADDIIAGYAQKVDGTDEAVIISADGDLFQCLTPKVWFHNPTSKKTTTISSFVDKWGVLPEQWASVKAMAGCKTDDIPGIKGIGDKTAAQWFSGKLKEGKKFKAILDNLDVYNNNLPLVRLPFPGLVLPDLVDDEITEASKLAVQVELGIRTDRSPKKKQKFTTTNYQSVGRYSDGFDI